MSKISDQAHLLHYGKLYVASIIGEYISTCLNNIYISWIQQAYHIPHNKYLYILTKPQYLALAGVSLCIRYSNYNKCVPDSAESARKQPSPSISSVDIDQQPSNEVLPAALFSASLANGAKSANSTMSFHWIPFPLKSSLPTKAACYSVTRSKL